MAPPAATCARLLAALEDLVAQEALLARAGDFAGVLATQERAAPLVASLAEFSATADAATRERAAAVLATRAPTMEWLDAEMGRVSAELQQMRISRRHAAQIGPAYGDRPPARFRAAG